MADKARRTTKAGRPGLAYGKGESPLTGFRLPLDLRQRLDAYATEQQQGRSEALRDLLTWALDRREKPMIETARAAARLQDRLAGRNEIWPPEFLDIKPERALPDFLGWIRTNSVDAFYDLKARIRKKMVDDKFFLISLSRMLGVRADTIRKLADSSNTGQARDQIRRQFISELLEQERLEFEAVRRALRLQLLSNYLERRFADYELAADDDYDLRALTFRLVRDNDLLLLKVSLNLLSNATYEEADIIRSLDSWDPGRQPFVLAFGSSGAERVKLQPLPDPRIH